MNCSKIINTASILSVLLICDLNPAFAQDVSDTGFIAANRFNQSDSLYTYAYIKHRIYKSFQNFSIPARVKKNLEATAAIADRLAAEKEQAGQPEEYKYLRNWIKHPELTEEEAKAYSPNASLNGGGPGHIACYPPCSSDTNGYGVFQQRITSWRELSYQYELKGDYLQAIRYRDSVIHNVRFSVSDLFHAKKLAIKARDTDSYLTLFQCDSFRSFNEKVAGDLSWSLARSPEDKMFIRSCLAKVDLRKSMLPRVDATELVLITNRFSRLHNHASVSIMIAYPGLRLLLHNRRKLRKLNGFLVEETYTKVPDAYCGYLSGKDRHSIAPLTISELGYFTLHLIQHNAFSQLYPPQLAENYFGFLECMAYHRMFDIEDYANYYDSYLTAVLHQGTKFGIIYRLKGNSDIESHKETVDVQNNRLLYHLVPLSQSINE